MNTLRFAVLLLCLTPQRAEPAKVDFDQGVDASQTLREARRQVPLNPIDKARVLLAQSAATTRSADKGAVIGIDVRERVDQSEPYQTAQQYPPLLENLKPEVRDPLKAQWNGINATRGELITEANGLEAEDRALATRAEALNRRTAELEQRNAELEAEIGNFNRQCTGRPLPPDEYNACARWRDDLVRRINAHNADIARHNTQVEQWRSEAADLRRRAGTESAAGKKRGKGAASFLIRVAAWEQRVVQFSAAAKKALEEGSCGRLKGLSINPSAPQTLRTGAMQDFTAVPSFEPPQDKPCPVTYLWTTQNTTGDIGRLAVDPKNEKRATLTTGSDDAKGSVTLEADEVLGKKKFHASVAVTVVKGAQQCQVEGTQCLPREGGGFTLICTYNCCGSTEIGPDLPVSSCLGAKCPIRYCAP